MRPAVSLSLLCAIAGAVLLGLVTFCVPINKDLWLFTIKKSDLRLHCGVFGYCVDTKCSRTSLGYTFDRMSVPGTNWSLPNKGALSSDLTYVLVLFPVGASAAYQRLALLSSPSFARLSRSSATLQPRYLLHCSPW